MQYYSLTNPLEKTNFATAVVNGIAPDRGLYFPESIPKLPAEFFASMEHMTVHEMATQAMLPYVEGDIPSAVLERIIQNTLDFDFPIVP
ncbi:threonine synthase, partial [Flavobacteriaceae bacterium]|nr:threonine synthase [Flavobacteriaceae bacterium]